ncbi:MAG: FAD-dependent oxidoreductase [Holdemanella sp.]|nr:FAD-dependent oxidoreductase [Holdemanella sp.]
MTNYYESLFTPFHIGKCEIKNRVVLCAMEGTNIVDWMMPKGFVKECRDYYIDRAQNNVGLMIPGMIPMRSMIGDKWLYKNPKAFKGVKNLMDEIHTYGSKVFFQLGTGFAGRNFTFMPFMETLMDNKALVTLAKPIFNMDALMVSASDNLPNVWNPDYKTRALTKDEIDEYIHAYAEVAYLCKQHGVDGVEVHAVHEGYLLDQFTTAYTNNRTDEYGGSLENRMRFTLECIEAIRANTPKGFPIIVKFTPHQRVEGFRTIEEGIEMAKILEKAGVDALHVDTGCYEEWFQAITTIYSDYGHKLDVHKAIKDVVSVPVLGDGKLVIPETAKQVVEEGTLDYVGLGHQMLADPYWPTKVKKGNEEDITPCVGCNECLMGGFVGKHYFCAVNPLCYAEKDYPLPAADGTVKDILVIGGGPAGMSAAIAAKKRGWNVDLMEKADRLGGTLWAAGGAKNKYDVIRLIKYMAKQCEKLGVNILLNTEATEANVTAKNYDKVILAAGSSPFTPNIEGMKENAVFACDYLTQKATVGNNVVVIGGGLAGTESAVDIAMEEGKSATVIEMLPDILAVANHCLNNDQHLRKLVKTSGVNVIAGAKVTKVASDSVTYEKDGETFTIPCDTVVNAVGFRANNQLEDFLLDHYDDVVVVGDAVAPRKIMTAVHEGYHAIRVME